MIKTISMRKEVIVNEEIMSPYVFLIKKTMFKLIDPVLFNDDCCIGFMGPYINII